MKISYLLILLFLISGCASVAGLGPEQQDESITTTGLDFTKYTDQGFLITPEKYLGEYQSIGLITVTLKPSVWEQKAGRRPSGEYIGQSWNIDPLNTTKAIDEIYSTAKKMGADAITQFNINIDYFLNGNLSVPKAEISGFAIKRK